MPDSSQTLESGLILYTRPIHQSLSCANHSISSTRTLDPYVSSARMLFDKIAQQPEENMEDLKSVEEVEDKVLMSNEVLEDSDEPVVSPTGGEAGGGSEPLSPVTVEENGDETEAWILENRSETDVDKALPAVPSSSSTWYEDVYEKPSMVGAGLVNLGNTCFFNAVLQCFTHSVLLVQSLFSFNHPTPCHCDNEQFCLICTLREHIELSLTSKGKFVRPWKFVDHLSYFSSSFQRYQQEDAHEFLQCFLDRLEGSISNLKVKDADNLVKQIFGGCVVSKLRCCNCNHISDTYEPSVDLSLEIDDANSLLTALESFTKVEHIEDEEMKFTCDECKEKVSVEKQLMLNQTAPICAFHLKRFKNDGSYVEKIDKHVEFPLELDLQPYTCGSQTDNVDLKYELYAVVVHAAYTTTFGHYYCYIRSAPDTWYKFDDSQVTNVAESQVLSEEAYILFYTKKGTLWFSNFMETYKPSLDLNLSNTSPKSVLENDMNESCANKVPVSELKNRAFKLESIKTTSGSNHNIIKENEKEKENSVLTLKEYGSNHRTEVKKSSPGVTPLKGNSEDFVSSVLSSGGKMNAFDIGQVVSPSTPPRSPGLDISDDEISDVVFAPKANQLKLADKKLQQKRQRSTEVEDNARQQALKQCKRMPGARGSLLMAALSESSINKKTKKMMTSSPLRNKYSRSSDQGFRHHHDKSVSRNLATSSFR